MLNKATHSFVASALRTIATCEVAALGHEARDYPVQDRA